MQRAAKKQRFSFKTIFLSLALIFSNSLWAASKASDCEAQITSQTKQTITEKELKALYREYFDQISKAFFDQDEALLLEVIEKESKFQPRSSYLTIDGAISKSHKLEREKTNEFIKEFWIWRKQLLDTNLIDDDYYPYIDMTLYVRAIVRQENFNPIEIFNLSLVFDDIYGSHLYEADPRILIRNLDSFLNVRHNLALAQSIFIARIGWKQANQKRSSLSQEEIALLSSQPAKLQREWRARFAESFSKVLFFWLPPLRSILGSIFRTIEPASPVDPIATNVAKQYLEQPWMPPMLARFRLELQNFKRNFKRLKAEEKSPLLEINVLDIALVASEGDLDKAVTLVGLMSIQRKALIRNLSKHYKKAGTHNKYIQPLIDSVGTYYLITQIAEIVDAQKKRIQLSESTQAKPAWKKISAWRLKLKSRYSFLYPAKYRVNNNKFYHFWSEVFLAMHLRKMGYSESLVSFGLKNVGRTYELATSISGIKLFRAFGFSIMRSFLLTKMFSDIRLHRFGVHQGLSIFRKLKKENKLYHPKQ